jgi:hypothetical protein
MGAHGIVVAPPIFADHLCFNPASEPFHDQAFVAELAVEAFRRPVRRRV